MSKACFSALLLAVCVLAPVAASAQYPARAVRIITSSPSGTAPDVLARAIGAHLTQSMKQAFFVEMRAGTVGPGFVAKSAPDGHTLLIATEGPFTSHPYLYKDLGFDALRDLVPVSSIMSQPFVLVVNPGLPAKTVREFIEHARRANPPLFYGSAGIGTSSHLAMEMLKSLTGINLVHVPVKGGGNQLVSLVVRGEVVATIGGTSVLPQVKAGNLVAIGTTAPQQSKNYPDLAAIVETVPGFDLGNWLGLFAPAGTPADVLARLRTEMNAYLTLADTREKFSAIGADPLMHKPEEFAARIRSDYVKYGKLIKELGLTPQ